MNPNTAHLNHVHINMHVDDIFESEGFPPPRSSMGRRRAARWLTEHLLTVLRNDFTDVMDAADLALTKMEG